MIFNPEEVGEKARNLAELEIMESEMLTRNRPDLSRMHKRLLDRYDMDLLGFALLTDAVYSRCRDGTGLTMAKGNLLKLASAAAAGKSSGSDNQTEPFAGRKIAFRNLLKPRKRSRPPRHHALALASEQVVQHVWTSLKNMDMPESIFADDLPEREFNDNMKEDFRCNLDSVAKVSSYMLKYHFRFRDFTSTY